MVTESYTYPWWQLAPRGREERKSTGMKEVVVVVVVRRSRMRKEGGEDGVGKGEGDGNVKDARGSEKKSWKMKANKA